MKFEKGQLVWFQINEKFGLYGTIEDCWLVENEIGEKEPNYIIDDFNNISHERYESEIIEVEKIEDAILKKSSCNIPLENIFKLFDEFDVNNNLYIEYGKNCVDVYYGESGFPYTINGFQCRLQGENLKDVLFELYLKMISKGK